MVSPLPIKDSTVSSMMFDVTCVRNRGAHKGGCEVAYCLVLPIAFIESGIAALSLASSTLIYPVNREPFARDVKWIKSSAFCIPWSLTAILLNPFVHSLVADEKSARTMASTGRLFTIPSDAYI